MNEFLAFPATYFPLVALIFCFSSWVQTVSGFGLALVAAPMLALVIGTKTAVPLISCIAFINGLFMAWHSYRSLNVREMILLIPASLLAMPLGVYFLAHGNENTLRFCLGVVVALFALRQMFGTLTSHLRNPFWALPFGAAAGFMVGAFNAGGPVVISYAQLRRWPAERFKGNLAIFVITINSMLLLVQYRNGISGPVIYLSTLALGPAIALGIFLGVLTARRISGQNFARITRWLLLILGILLMV